MNIIYDTIFEPGDEYLNVMGKGLYEYSLSKGKTGEENRSAYAVLARNADSAIIGGIYCHLRWDWLFINMLWIDEHSRGEGIGAYLLEQGEARAMSQGFYYSHLETTDFQAVDFYLKHGYDIFGQLDGKPAGSVWYYLKKDLTR